LRPVGLGDLLRAEHVGAEPWQSENDEQHQRQDLGDHEDVDGEGARAHAAVLKAVRVVSGLKDKPAWKTGADPLSKFRPRAGSWLWAYAREAVDRDGL
jgi:hypothetical protein